MAVIRVEIQADDPNSVLASLVVLLKECEITDYELTMTREPQSASSIHPPADKWHEAEASVDISDVVAQEARDGYLTKPVPPINPKAVRHPHDPPPNWMPQEAR